MVEEITISEILEAIDIFSGPRVGLVAAVLLASNRPVEGRTRIIKYVFLLQERALEQRLLLSGETFEFKPFPLGPFSVELASTIEFLRELDIIKISIRSVNIETPVGSVKSERYDYSVTDKGRIVFERILNRFGDRGEKLKQLASMIRSKWDSRTVKELVEYVHRKYPQYMVKQNIF